MILDSNSNTVIPLRKASRKLASSEKRELRAEGKYRYELPYIEKGTRDWCLFAISRYLWDIGYGEDKDEERADKLWTWLIDRRLYKTNSQIKIARAAIDRIVRWRPCNVEKSDSFSEETQEEMIDRRLTPQRMIAANHKRTVSARTEIAAAKERLEERGNPVNVLSLHLESGKDKKTIRKHRDVWMVVKEGSGTEDLELKEDLNPILLSINANRTQKKGAVKNANCS